MARSESAVEFQAVIKERGLYLREAGRQLGVTHVAIRAWETGKRVPEVAYREAIEVWSGGRVRKDGWGLSRRERALRKKLAALVPRATGTDG